MLRTEQRRKLLVHQPSAAESRSGQRKVNKNLILEYKETSPGQLYNGWLETGYALQVDLGRLGDI